MRKLLLAFVVFTAFQCENYEDFSVRPVSFDIDGRTYYSAKDTRVEPSILGNWGSPVIMAVKQYGDSLDISYYRKSDFINYGIEELGLNLRGALGSFKVGERINYTVEEIPETYYQYESAPYVVLNPIRTSTAADTDVYTATEGWIEFTEINVGSKTLSGKFEFNAVLADDAACSHKSEIEVKNGTFQNIPFSFTETFISPTDQIQ